MNEQAAHKGVNNPSKPFTLIFFIEMWERFGYYGMVALLVVFMINKLGFSDNLALNTYGAFSALVYAFLSVGGYLGDRVLGTKRTMVLGAIVLCLGYLSLSYNPSKTIYIGLALIIVGNMMFKANPSSLVSKLYKTGDPRLDSAFTMYYMSINVGSFISMTLCPIVNEKWGYAPAFFICAIGLILAIVGYLSFRKYLAQIGSEPDFKPLSFSKTAVIIIGMVIMVFICAFLLKHLRITSIILILAMIATFSIVIVFIIIAKTSQERMGYFVCLVLIIEAIVFYILYQQMQTSLNLFTIRNTDCKMLGMTVPGIMFQNLNPFWIIIGSPVFAFLYNALGKKEKDFSIPGKFAFGMLLCSLGFLVLPFAVKFYAHSNYVISGNWIILTYFFQSTGELLVSALGLSMVTKLVPQKNVGFMMGAWFMATAVAMALGGFVASLASISKDAIGQANISLPIYSNLFLNIGLVSLGISVVMFIFVPKLKQYMK